MEAQAQIGGPKANHASDAVTSPATQCAGSELRPVKASPTICAGGAEWLLPRQPLTCCDVSSVASEIG